MERPPEIPERRAHTRVAPDRDRPLGASLEGQDLEVRDISVGGIGFRSPRPLATDQSYPVVLTLPGAAAPLKLAILVREVRPRGNIHGSFQGLPPQDSAAIATYVLERQQELVSEVLDSEQELDSPLP